MSDVPDDVQRPALSYAAGPIPSARRWGRASCARAAIALSLIAYLFLEVYAVRPQDTVKLVFVWPLVLTFCLIGLTYGVLGLRRDARKAAAIVGLVLCAILTAPAVRGTTEAVREVHTAYRFRGGVIIVPDR